MLTAGREEGNRGGGEEIQSVVVLVLLVVSYIKASFVELRVISNPSFSCTIVSRCIHVTTQNKPRAE